MRYPGSRLAQTIVQCCKAHRISQVVISPGSRNAPLIIGFTEDIFFSCYSIVDERCAAFFALGLAQQLQQPVVVVCTSGSALLNYYPAVAEAFYSDIPLVVISADRPPGKIDIGDGQTIRQSKVFANHILYSADLQEDAGLATAVQHYNEESINEALGRVLLEKGPVHLNAPFEEPLYETVSSLSVAPQAILPKYEEVVFEEALAERFVQDWNEATRKMVLVGALHPGSVEEWVVNLLANDPSVLVFTETTSNLHHPNFFPGIDKILAPVEEEEGELKRLQPGLLLTFGGMVVSKKIKAFLRAHPPKAHYHIDRKRAYDTYFCLTGHFKTGINLFFERLSSRLLQLGSDYRDYWLEVQLHRRERHAAYLKTMPFSDLAAYRAIFKAIPSGQQLQVANSATVRYAQLFELDASLRVFCNRGTSGIEGSLSTALGASLGNKAPTTLLTGDLSFFYDNNGLWNGYRRKDFTVLLVNNRGGGIFRVLPGAQEISRFEEFVETTHELSAQPLCDLYGWTYRRAVDLPGLERELLAVYEGDLAMRDKPVLLEVFTPRLVNAEVLRGYFSALRG